MKSLLRKFSRLYAKSGLLLFLLRLPTRGFKVLRNHLSTMYWKLFLGKVGKNIFIEYGVNFGSPKQITIGNYVYIGSGTEFGSETIEGNIIIGDNVHIGRNCSIDHSGRIILEDNVLLSAGVQIFSHSHGHDPRSKPVPHNLLIRKNCWIGNNCMILEKTETIEEGIIIAAGSIVIRPCVNKKSIFAGSPALFKKEIEEK